MSELPSLTDDELQRATSRTPPAQATLVAETAEAAAAREAFLSLGAALETAGGQFDKSALVRRLHATLLDSLPPTSQCALAERTKPRTVWPLLAGGVLATSLAGLFIVLGGTSQKRRPIVVIAEPQKSIATSRRPEQPIDSAVAQHAAPGDASPAATPWTDPLDGEISRAAAAILQLAGRERGLDHSLVEATGRVEALMHELQSETL